MGPDYLSNREMREGGGIGCCLRLQAVVRVPRRVVFVTAARCDYLPPSTDLRARSVSPASTMGVEGCTKLIKYLLFFLNFIFWVRNCIFLFCF